MVQVIQTGNPQGKLAEMLGLSLGQGLGSGINTYFANKALEDVLNDKSNTNQPISAKMGRLQSALAPYGEKGQELLQNRMAIEQQAYQGQAAKEAQKAAFEKEQRLFQQQKELQEMKNKGKPPLGGLGGTPLSPEESKIISDVIKESPNANAEELELKFNERNISPGRTKTILESRRRQDELKARTGEIREQETEKAQAQQDIKYNQQLQEAFKQHELKNAPYKIWIN